MPPDVKLIRRASLVTLALTTLALGACANTPLLMPYPSEAKHTSRRPPPPPNPRRLSADMRLLQGWFDSPSAEQSTQIAAAEADYQRTHAPRETLRLALLLGIPGTAATDLPRAQRLLKGLMQDPSNALLPGERTLAQLALTFVADRLTQSAENRTLQTAGAAKIAKLKAQLDAVTDQDVALRRQLEQARAKLAAIANIEKSLNEGKLGPTKPPR
ncbi:MAG: hypothetical protein ACP5PN_10990 [Steroidobacteraceae bacterium]